MKSTFSRLAWDLFLERVLWDLVRNNGQLANQRRAAAMDGLPNSEAVTIDRRSKNNSNREKLPKKINKDRGS